MQSAYKEPNLTVIVGETVCRIHFTVIQLLFGVDLVLGIKGLALWNPMMDWRLQRMNIWIGREWNQI